MALGHHVRRLVKDALRKRNFEIVHTSLLYKWQHADQSPAAPDGPLPQGAADYLRFDNPRLLELQSRYEAFDRAVTTPAVWNPEYLTASNLLYFRSDNPYVFQLRGRNMNEMAYTLTYYAARRADRLCLLDTLEEDGQFGACTFRVDDRLVSRDLLDSVAELNFLDRHLDLRTLDDPSILDIGAGYGRLAHRAVNGLANLRYYCTDAIATSTFISEYYLSYRGVSDRAHVIPLDEIAATLARSKPRIAVNIHSFSECRLDAIGWWIGLLRSNEVPYLMIVPNNVAADNVTMLTNAGDDFTKVITSKGYRLLASEPKYRDPLVQEYGINPIRHFLFGLR
jgi:hypothetical protein